MSFGSELTDSRLAPIHQWAQFPFDHRGKVDVHLSVNPITTAYPIDFRTESEVKSQALSSAEAKAPSPEATNDMMKKAMKVSGERDSWIFSGHPATLKKMGETSS